MGKAHARGDRLKAVAVTAYARGADKLRAIEAGFDEHVAKPVEPPELVSVIASLAGDFNAVRGTV